MAGDLTALDEDLLVQGDADGLAGMRLDRRRWRAPAFDGSDVRCQIRRREQQAVADPKDAGLDTPGKNTAIIELVDVLDRETQRLTGRPRDALEAVERLQHGRAVEPSQVRGRLGQIVAHAGRNRQDIADGDADFREVVARLSCHLIETGLVVIDQVHLVDHDADLTHAQEVQQVGVAARLLLHALGGIDHQHRGVGRCRAADHVLEELAVSGRIDDDVVALGALEPDLRRVDGDGLVALRLKGVEQEGPLGHHAAAGGDRFDLGHLALRHGVGVEQQPADQSGLAVIHVADDDDAQGLVEMQGLRGA